MKLLPLLLFSFYIQLGFAQTKKRSTDEDKLNKCLSENTHYFSFEDKRPIGEGWNILTNLFAENQFVAWGEYHNSPQLSQLTRYALKSASEKGFKNWCIETSPFAASELSNIAKLDSPFAEIQKINGKRKNFVTFPFFETKEDAAMLQAANQFGFSIWGIDQEFQMAFPYCLDKAYQSLSSKKKQNVKAIYDSLQAHWWNPDSTFLNLFKKELNPKMQNVVQDVSISKDIYYYSDNQKRANLMKKNFYTYYDHLKSNKGKIFFKMGSNHLAKGINIGTNLYDIGNAVYELSQRNQSNFANVYFMVRYTEEKGKVTDDFTEENNQNPKVFDKLYDQFKWVIVDIKSLRLRMRYDNSLTTDTYKLIEKYDYVVVSPEILK